MWVQAFDLLLSRMTSAGFPFSSVAAFAVSGQQHGTVYWAVGADERLQHLDPSKTLDEELEDCFTLEHSPVWMDSSTAEECREMEDEVKKRSGESIRSITGAKGVFMCVYV